MTSPADESSVAGSPVTVTGTTAPGNQLYIAATNTDANSATTVVSTTAAPDGSFSVGIAVTGGTSVINVVAVAPDGATAHQQRTVVFDFVPGTVLLDVTDPTGDDNGPGNYAYPTSDNFHAGAFDLTRFQVIDSGANIVFRVQTRDLTPTFGSPLGAQLVDVYVHDPAAAPADTSTAASFPQRNYQIAPTFAWSRLVEVQGFGQRYIDAHGTTLGTVAITRQPDLPLHHLQRAQVVTRHSRIRLGLHRRSHRPGRLQPRPGAQLRPDTAALPVRRLRHRKQRPALHRRPQHRPQDARRDHAGGCQPVRRARLHPAQPSRPTGDHSPLTGAIRDTRRGGVVRKVLVFVVVVAAMVAVAATMGRSGRQAALPVPRPTVSEFEQLSSSTTPPTEAQCFSVGRRCFTPQSMTASYNVTPLYAGGNKGQGRTIAIVDSYGSDTIAHDLAVFDNAFGLPHMCGEEGVTCTAGMPTFSQLALQGSPATKAPPGQSKGTGLEDKAGWALEVSLDVEWAHATAPMANILLVTTPTAETLGVQGFPQMMAAEDYVVQNHLADVISQSFGSGEGAFGSAQSLLNLRYAFVDAQANHVSVFASSGDGGTTNTMKQPVKNPAADPVSERDLAGFRSAGDGGRRHLSVHGSDHGHEHRHDGSAGPLPAVTQSGLAA